MHQRKTLDPSSIITGGGATIAYGHSDHPTGTGSSTAIRNVTGHASLDTHHKRKKRVRRRHRARKRRSLLGLSCSVPAGLVLLGILLFGLLWIRLLWHLGSKNTAAEVTQETAAVVTGCYQGGKCEGRHGCCDCDMSRDQCTPSEGTWVADGRCRWICAAKPPGDAPKSPDHAANADADSPPPVFRLVAEEAPSCQEMESPEAIDTTLVTQLSDDRLWMMKHHCERYGPHSMSIAVYSNKTEEEILTELEGMGCNMANGGEKQQHPANALVSVRVLDARSHGSWNEYPVNELRNLALAGVQTTHITYIDVDFWPSEGLHDALLSPSIRRKLFEDPKLALVLPAFQLKRNSDCRDETKDCREEHVPKMPRTVSQLVQRVTQDKSVQIFDPTNRGGHGSTNYQHWFHHQLDPQHKQNEGGSLYEIPCLKSHRYEPFLTLRYCRELTPPFQSAFAGYGKNKMTWTMQVVASGFVFAQVGGAYLVHYPHAVSKSREHWNEAPDQLVQKRSDHNYSVRRPKASDGDLGFEKYQRGKIDDLYLRFKEWLAQAIPADRARLELCGDAQDDDNSLWVDPNRKHWKQKR